jgi:hypothetical protein
MHEIERKVTFGLQTLIICFTIFTVSHFVSVSYDESLRIYEIYIFPFSVLWIYLMWSRKFEVFFLLHLNNKQIDKNYFEL